MKRYREALTQESHYSKPLSHRQKAKGIAKRCVSYNSANVSVMLGCMKHQLHKSLRAEDKAACLDEEVLFEAPGTWNRTRVKTPKTPKVKEKKTPVKPGTRTIFKRSESTRPSTMFEEWMEDFKKKAYVMPTTRYNKPESRDGLPIEETDSIWPMLILLFIIWGLPIIWLLAHLI